MTVTVELTRDGDRLEIICDGLRPREVRLSPPPPGASPVVPVDGGRAQVDVDPSVPRYVATLKLDGGYRRVPERHVNLSGAANFRDLGGYGLPACCMVRWASCSGRTTWTTRQVPIVRRLPLSASAKSSTCASPGSGRRQAPHVRSATQLSTMCRSAAWSRTSTA